jgi:hypothetical protein
MVKKSATFFVGIDLPVPELANQKTWYVPHYYPSPITINGIAKLPCIFAMKLI